MANLEQLINEKQAADTQWREQRQTERQTVTDTQDSEITRITTDPAAYARYLNMQADNLSYSPGNIALVMAQSPTATVFGTPERWRSMGRNVQSAELGKGIGIFARSEQGYVMADAFDISQTDGRELRKPPQLTDESKEMEGALKALLNYSVVPVVADTEMETPAFYDQSNLELAINPAYSDSEAFAAIAAEVAHSRFHKRGYNADYLRADCDLDAQSISYILCRRFGVSRDLPDLSKLSDLYRDWPPESRRAILDGIQDLSKKMGYSIEKDIKPPQRSIPVTRKPPKHNTR